MHHRLGAVIHILGADTEHAIDTADDAPEHAADRGADDTADRAGNTVAFMETVVGASRDALRLGAGDRHGKRREASGGKQQFDFHWATSRFWVEWSLSDGWTMTPYTAIRWREYGPRQRGRGSRRRVTQRPQRWVANEML